MKKKIIILLLCLFSFNIVATEGSLERSEVNIKGSEVSSISSLHTKKEYDLWISRPLGYEGSDKHYPVIYLLDAQWDFTLMISLYGQLRADGDIPPAILVGITWHGDNVNYDSLRVQDFLPVSNEKNSGKHGAENFLTFFEEELIPYVDSEYRTSDERLLVGSSFAGWFSLYAMFNRPDIFDGFLVTAPTVQLIESYILKHIQGFAEKVKKSNTRMYLAVGNRDSNLAGYEEALTFFKENNFKGLTYQAQVFDNMGHSSIKGNGNTRGLQFLFKRNK